MFVRCRPNSAKNKWVISICHSTRNGDKVSQKVIRYLGVAHSEEQKKALIQLGEAEIRKLTVVPEAKVKMEDRCDGMLLADVTERARLVE